MRARLLGFVGSIVSLLVACAGATADAPAVQAPTGAASSAAPSAATNPASAAPDAGATGTIGKSAGDPKACGCQLCEPVVSEDACTADADCAPSTPCHAEKCVAKAKATPKQPGTMCTQMMMCTSIDANACGCVKGKCTLHAR